MGGAANCLAGTNAGHVITVGDGSATAGCAAQLTAILPVKVPPGAVVVADGIATLTRYIIPETVGTCLQKIKPTFTQFDANEGIVE